MIYTRVALFLIKYRSAINQGTARVDVKTGEPMGDSFNFMR